MDLDAAEPDTYGRYLGEVLVNRRGFTATVPDAIAPITAACDRVFARVDGPVLRVSCIVDADARPGASFAMPSADVLTLGLAWVEAEKRAGRKRPVVVIAVYEVGAGTVTTEAEQRLAEFKTDPRLRRGVVLQAVLIDPERRLLWDNAQKLFGRSFAFRWLKPLLAKPRLSKAELAPAVIADDIHRFPVLTAAVLVLLLAVFAAEVLFPVVPWTGLLKADIRTLLGFGGVNRNLVLGSGQWWRVATAPFLHGDALHILFNGWALWLIGRLSERLMGPAWFAAVFTVSALSGSAMSIALNPANLLSVGASGAIVGLFAASFTLSFHLPPGAARSRLQRGTIGTLVPALIPFLSSPTGGVVDYGAHGGGAGAGVIMGYVMLSIWPKASPRPRFQAAATTVAVLGLVVAVAAVVPDVTNYRNVSLVQELFEPFPKTNGEAQDQAETMIAAKPHDPRARFAHAMALGAAQDLGGAEAELRTGLAEKGLLDLIDPPHYEDRMRIVLGAVLKDENRPEEARAAVTPACSVETAGPLHDSLDKLQLCP